MTSVTKEPRLPRCVTKFDLITYFNCNYRYLWRRIITVELLEEWGIDIPALKRARTLDPFLTKRLYEHFKITDLDKRPQDEIEAVTEGEQAPTD